MSDVTLSALAKRGAWDSKHPYFTTAEEHMAILWETLIWPLIRDCDFTSVIDLAAGHGRNSVFLAKFARSLWVMDVTRENVAICAERLKGRSKVQCIVNNGYDFDPVADASVTLIYCFDAMVHFDSDLVRSYLRDAKRVLVPGGRCFFHHSNYSNSDASLNAGENPHGRAFMSAELFKHYARKEGLSINRQIVMDWGGVHNLDCITMVENSGEPRQK